MIKLFIRFFKTPKYSDLKEIGDRMRKKQVKDIDIDTYRAIMCDFYTYKVNTPDYKKIVIGGLVSEKDM